MPDPSYPNSTRQRVRRHRERLRAQGLRPVQIWVPDVRTSAFKDAARQQSRAVANSPYEPADQAFIDTIAEPDDEPGGA